MLTLSIKHDLEKMLAVLGCLTAKQLRYAARNALTATGRDAELVLKREMQREFDRPRPFTINSLYTKPASLSNLSSQVLFREYAGKGTAAGDYLRPQIVGGGRQQKRSERSLSIRFGISNLYMVPAADAPLDEYGNVAASKYVEVLSFFKAFSQTGYIANRNVRSRRGVNADKYFVVLPNQPSPGVTPGIYEKKGHELLKIFTFIPSPTYRRRFDFYGVGVKTAQERFPQRFYEQVRAEIAAALRLGTYRRTT